MDGPLLSRAIELVLTYGLLAICVFAFLESSMLFPYLPAEVVVPVSAGALVTGWSSLGAFVAVTTAGGTVGALFAYGASKEGGRLASTKFGTSLRISDRHRKQAKSWYDRWGEPSVMWGRLFPGLRSVVSIPAGLARMPLSKFTVYTVIGTAGFYFAVAGIVYYGRSRALDDALVAAITNAPLETVAILAFVCLATLAVWWAESYRS